jgi:hypothetical protein
LTEIFRKFSDAITWNFIISKALLQGRAIWDHMESKLQKVLIPWHFLLVIKLVSWKPRALKSVLINWHESQFNEWNIHLKSFKFVKVYIYIYIYEIVIIKGVRVLIFSLVFQKKIKNVCIAKASYECYTIPPPLLSDIF